MISTSNGPEAFYCNAYSRCAILSTESFQTTIGSVSML